MVVFLKTSEEATCDTDVCLFTYTGSIPILETAVASFDTSSLEWIVTVTGTDFSGDESTTELHFSDVA
jgi:hypothetical protein